MKRNETVKRTALARELSFTAIPEAIFKTARISVHFLLPMEAESLSANALLPYLLCRGEDFTALNRRLDSLYGAKLSASVGKTANAQQLSLSIEVIRSRFADAGDDPVGQAAALLSDLILHPNVTDGAFPEADVAAEKQNLLGLIAAEQNEKRTYAINRAFALIFENEPLGLDKYGEPEQVEALDGRILAATWAAVLRRARVEILYLGDPADADSVRAVFEKAFAALSPDRRPETPAVVKTPVWRDVPAEVTERLDVTQSKLVIGLRTPLYSEDDYAALQLMDCLYGMSPTSRLFANVRERLSLCYYCVARAYRQVGLVLVDCGVLAENIPAARAEILAQLRIVADGAFDDSELCAARLYLQNIYRGAAGSLSGLEAVWLSQILTGAMRSPEQLAERLDAIDKKQLMQCAKNCHLDTVYVLTGPSEADTEGR